MAWSFPSSALDLKEKHLKCLLCSCILYVLLASCSLQYSCGTLDSIRFPKTYSSVLLTDTADVIDARDIIPSNSNAVSINLPARPVLQSKTLCNLSLTEFEALESLYSSTGGPFWVYPLGTNESQTWTFPLSSSGNGDFLSYPCGDAWSGVECVATSGTGSLATPTCTIKALDLSNYNLQGFLPKDISALTNISELILYFNSLTSTIPNELYLLTNLQTLDLHHNNLAISISQYISKLSNLIVLDLSSNKFSGELPKNFGEGLSKLSILDLRASSFSTQFKFFGLIPESIGMMTSLTLLSLRFNQFSSSLPFLGNLNSLNTLDLSYNRLNSSIDAVTALSSNLTTLKIMGNAFGGTIPSNISNLKGLEHFQAYNNRISGSLPSEIYTISSMVLLELDGNNITGSLSHEISKLANLEKIYLDSNFFSHSIPPEIVRLSKLSTLYLAYNNFVGPIPSQIGNLTELVFLSLENNLLSNVLPTSLGALTKLQEIILNSNRITGPIPCELGSLIKLTYMDLHSNIIDHKIPSSLSELTLLKILRLEDNYISHSIPHHLSTLVNLFYFDVSFNTIFGSLPPEYSSLLSLGLFDCSRNYFLGDPFFFIKLPLLQNINVSQNYFDDSTGWAFLPDNPNPNLLYFDISHNKISGYLLPMSKYSPNLQLFVAESNCLNTQLPDDLCNLRNLSSLIVSDLGRHCASTSISSAVLTKKYVKIPECIWDMTTLSVVYMESNLYYGSIPDGSALSGLTIINLIGNRLTGPIPKSLQTSTTLRYLQLAFNRFDGTLSESLNLSTSADGAVVELYANRISGNFPNSLRSISGINVVTGNLFQCHSTIKNDIGGEAYSCGSNILDNSLYTFAVSVGFVIVLLFINIYCQFIPIKTTVDYYRSCNYDETILTKILSRKSQIIICAISTFSIILQLVMAGYDYIFKFQTHEVEYAWVVTYAFNHGLFPYVIIVSILLYCQVYLLRERKSGELNDICRMSNKLSKSGNILPDITQVELSSVSSLHDTSKIVFDCVNNTIDTHSWKLFGLETLNFLTITAANIIYIYIENLTSVSYKTKQLIPLYLGFFKSAWNVLFVPFMLKSAHIEKGTSILVHDLISSIYLNVLSPLIIILLTDVNCFLYSYTPLPSVTVTFPRLDFDSNCVSTVNNTDCELVSFPLTSSHRNNPLWLYGYQCSDSVVTIYTPVILVFYIANGIFLPIIQILLINLPDRAKEKKYIFRFYRTILRFCYENLDNDKEKWRTFRTSRHLSSITINLIIIMTYGIAVPYIAIVAIITLFLQHTVIKLQLGKYLAVLKEKGFKGKISFEDTNSLLDSDAALSEEINNDNISVLEDKVIRIFDDNALAQYDSYVFLILITISLFWTIFLFDFIADSYGDITGLALLILFIVLYWALWFRKAIVERSSKLAKFIFYFAVGNIQKSEFENRESAGISMESTQKVKTTSLSTTAIDSPIHSDI